MPNNGKNAKNQNQFAIHEKDIKPGDICVYFPLKDDKLEDPFHFALVIGEKKNKSLEVLHMHADAGLVRSGIGIVKKKPKHKYEVYRYTGEGREKLISMALKHAKKYDEFHVVYNEKVSELHTTLEENLTIEEQLAEAKKKYVNGRLSRLKSAARVMLYELPLNPKQKGGLTCVQFIIATYQTAELILSNAVRSKGEVEEEISRKMGAQVTVTHVSNKHADKNMINLLPDYQKMLLKDHANEQGYNEEECRSQEGWGPTFYFENLKNVKKHNPAIRLDAKTTTAPAFRAYLNQEPDTWHRIGLFEPEKAKTSKGKESEQYKCRKKKNSELCSNMINAH